MTHFERELKSESRTITKERILIVEDEGIVARDIRLSLQQAGYDVPATADSGAQAIELSHRWKPDLVLIDIVLKGPIDGVETARRIRTEQSIPVLFLTAYADEPTLKRAKQTRPIGYLMKPFSVRGLQATIEVGLHQFRAQLQAEAKLRGLLELAPDAVMVVDERGEIEMVNAAAERMFGYGRNELVGQSADILVPGIWQAALRQSREEQEAAPVTRPICVGLDRVARRKDGIQFPVKVSLTPVAAPAGHWFASVIRGVRPSGPASAEFPGAPEAETVRRAGGRTEPMPRLSRREREVLLGLAWGKSAKEIGAQLKVSVKTVDTYKQRVKAKTGLRTRTEIVQFALSQGWLSGDSTL